MNSPARNGPGNFRSGEVYHEIVYQAERPTSETVPRARARPKNDFGSKVRGQVPSELLNVDDSIAQTMHLGQDTWAGIAVPSV